MQGKVIRRKELCLRCTKLDVRWLTCMWLSVRFHIRSWLFVYIYVLKKDINVKCILKFNCFVMDDHCSVLVVSHWEVLMRVWWESNWSSPLDCIITQVVKTKYQMSTCCNYANGRGIPAKCVHQIFALCTWLKMIYSLIPSMYGIVVSWEGNFAITITYTHVLYVYCISFVE